MGTIRFDVKKLLVALLCALFTVSAACIENVYIPSAEDALKILNIDCWLTIILAKFYLTLNNYSVATNIIFIGTSYFYYKRLGKFNYDFSIMMLSSLFSIFILVGKSFHNFDNLDYICGNSFQIIFSLLQFLGWGILFYFLIDLLYEFIEKNKENAFQIPKRNFRWLILLPCCWLPIFITFFPANFNYDTFWMLAGYSGEWEWTTHHPIIPTILLGKIMDLGLLIGDANVGALICVIMQTLSMFCMIYYLLVFMMQLKTSLSLFILTVLFFSLCPIWSVYAQTVIKDTFNMIFCVGYIICYLKIILNVKWVNDVKNLSIFSICILGTCFFRNTGIFLVSLSIIPVIFSIKIKKLSIKKLGLCFLLCILTVNIVNQYAITSLNIVLGSKGEMLSIPFQQTARYLKEYPDDVSEKEHKAIENLLEYDTLANAYKPNISDAVKSKMHSQQQENIIEYFKAWKSMLFKHPGVYIEATLNNVYGYFYPDGISKARSTGLKLHIESSDYIGSPNTGRYNVRYVNERGVRAFAIFCINEIWRQIPILGLCYNTGIYTWILIICIALLIRYKKYYEILGTLPSILTILFCIASPVNGYVRYMLPVMAATPLMIAWTLYAIREPATVSYQKKVNKKKTKK